MLLMCGANFNDSFVVNCPQSVPVKELLKSINIWTKAWCDTYVVDHGVQKYKWPAILSKTSKFNS